MYSSAWLNDEKLIQAGDLVEAWFNRILCAVNDVDFKTGRFEFRDSPLPPEYICPKARITQEQFKKLIELELISKDRNGVFFIKSWEKYQDKSRVFRHGARVGEPIGARVGEPIGALIGDQEGALNKVNKVNKVNNLKDLNLPPKADEILTPHRKLCLFWTETMISETGNKGPFTGRDGKNLVELLKVADPKNVERVILWAIKMGRKDKYISQKCDRLYKIYENWNILFSKVSGEKVVSLAGSKYKSETVG